MTTTQQEPWLTTRELADRLNVSPRTIQRLDLPRLRVGGQNRFLLSEVLTALRGGDNVVPFRPRRKERAA